MLEMLLAARWLLIIAAGFGLLVWVAHRSLYYPMRYPQGWWQEQARIGAVDVWLTTRDGVKLHGWYLQQPGAELVTLFLHGNAGNVTHRALAMAAIGAAGSSVLVIDYRGYGKSEGRPSERGLYADADAAYDYLVAQGHTPDKIIVHGESLGSAVAVELASRRPIKGLILESPFTTPRDVAGRVFPVLGPMVISGYDSLARIGKVRVPLFVIHGSADEIIHVSLGRDLFEAANPPKELWVVEGAGHNNLVAASGDAYIERVKAFHLGLR